MLKVNVQNVDTGESFDLWTNDLQIPACANAMLFVGPSHFGTRARLVGPGISTEKEALTIHDQSVPDMPFALIPGVYRLELFIDSDDIEDEVRTFEVVNA